MADNIKVISSSVTVDVDAPTNKRKSTGTAVSGEAKFIEEGKEKLWGYTT